MPRRSTTLDLVRTIAIAMLVVGHVGNALGIHSTQIRFDIPGIYTFSLADSAVTIFLILSGLTLQISYKKNISRSKFYSKRLTKIYPIYIFCLIIGLATHIYRNILETNSLGLANLPPQIWLCSLTGFCAFIGEWGGPFLVTGWFIGLIICLYLAFPYLSNFLQKSPHLGLCTTFFMSATTHLLSLPLFFDLPYRPEQWFPPNRLFEFTLGIYLAVVVNKSKFYFLDNTLKPIKNVLKHISNFSFPYFLVHYAFIFLVKLLPTLGYSVANTLLIYFSVTISLSYIVQKLAKKLLIIDR